MKNKIKIILQLFLTFMKVGAFTFGGGLAMIPLIQREVVEKKKWITDDDILEIVAIAESTPGPIAINAATFVGYKVCGFFGSLFSTLGVVLPSFVIIFALSAVLRGFKELEVVQYAFFGIRAGVLALIVKALVTMFKKSKKSWVAFTVMIGAFLAVAFFGANVLFVMMCCALFGLITSLIKLRRDGK